MKVVHCDIRKKLQEKQKYNPWYGRGLLEQKMYGIKKCDVSNYINKRIADLRGGENRRMEGRERKDGRSKNRGRKEN
ncbi:hypothetical protein [Xenorhabdus eapokensis]|uniref:Uncharacterized protein n=1 Tax=Xenorhabdus eapokensis TaxID=1873482 RepID=A0A1Q5TWM2_9GAMM|nr:hypothetical protein [Xenorhabdus eapokensis]OKP04621.1 hypothetical protein Xedl_00986 [Xenorhabdus eapokensis]